MDRPSLWARASGRRKKVRGSLSLCAVRALPGPHVRGAQAVRAERDREEEALRVTCYGPPYLYYIAYDLLVGGWVFPLWFFPAHSNVTVTRGTHARYIEVYVFTKRADRACV